MVKRYTLSCPSPDGFAVEPFDADLLKATVIVRGTDYDALAARLADMTAEADSWRANARDSGEEARKYKARLAEAERDAARYRWLAVQTCGDVYMETAGVKAQLDAAVDAEMGATDSETACGVCKGTGFHPGPYMCVICGGTGSTASAEHRHIYKHNADDTYGICECGKAFKVCPSCGMEIDATGETVDAAPNSHHE